MRTLVPTLLLLAILQGNPAPQGDKGFFDKRLKDTAELIVKKTKETQETVDKDVMLIRLGFKDFAIEYKELGFTDEQIVMLLTVSWKRLRGVPEDDGMIVGKPLVVGEKLEVVKLRKAASAYGMLIVISDPLGADVTVRGANWGQTKTEAWEEQGKHKIVIAKGGHETKEDTVMIVAGKKQEYKVTLKKANGP